MELRHLRYFVAVAEEGSLTNAAERRLHAAQPSLSRQIRDLELEVGVKLLERKARGIELTAAGRVFLDHARLALMQIEVACEAARGAEKPEKLGFVIGFLLGQEAIWLSESLRVLREEAADVGIWVGLTAVTTHSRPTREGSVAWLCAGPACEACLGIDGTAAQVSNCTPRSVVINPTCHPCPQKVSSRFPGFAFG